MLWLLRLVLHLLLPHPAEPSTRPASITFYEAEPVSKRYEDATTGKGGW